MARSRREVAGCIPFRQRQPRSGEPALAHPWWRLPEGASVSDALEVLLVQSKYAEDVWLFPKGGVKRKETRKEAAVRETREEAGVEGVVEAKLGTWRVWSEEEHTMYLLRVEREYSAHDETWEERYERPRWWLPLPDAMQVLRRVQSRRPELLDMLKTARKKLETIARKQSKAEEKRLKREQEKAEKRPAAEGDSASSADSEDDDDEEEEEEEETENGKEEDARDCRAS
ncbi:hypothetical protein CDCA_CDCA03G0930 [Cyanidium caldarium]|uniref:Nudix hydrolase domain-containing protein n=1 Tax=Cyanidium caldarium TaxID=2771 RepID=A0AAV9IRH2_CYACA|nr:hypothetical protein CDCA_CDCA03G0930 [Cyanidium caldarium]